MKKTPWLVKLVLALSGVLSIAAFAVAGPGDGETVIYGDDDRLDLYQIKSSRDLSLADSTVVLMKDTTLTENGEVYDIDAGTFGDDFGLCESEPFRDQPSGGFCSGALVGDDLLITAGHCIEDESECEGTRFVFGYHVKKEGEFPTSAPIGEVYSCAEIIKRDQQNSGADYALIRLDRKVSNHRPLAIDRSGELKAGDNIGVIGHPSGLPVKVAFGNSVVRDVDTEGYFLASLDTYGGNSGSAVFNTKTGLIEGILVRGETDFVYTPEGCRVSNVCKEDECRGEDVTKISELADLIPEVGAPPPPDGGGGSSWPTIGRRARRP
jgi:hypothetical protein